MESIHVLSPEIRFDIYTLVPRRFFEESLTGPFTYYQYLTDIGMAQKGPLHPDPEETVKRLDRIFPMEARRLNGLVSSLQERRNRLVVSDISPMGIFVAKEAGIPSVLVENFTWDWIYAAYQETQGMERHALYLKEIFDGADYRIQTDPVCRARGNASRVPPISRAPRKPALEVRARLGVSNGDRLVLITLGGVPGSYEFLERLTRVEGVLFVVPGASETFTRKDNLILLPRHSEYYHPDLVHAVDAVAGKAGYSTLAEVFRAGVPFGYVLPERFPESDHLAGFIRDHMPGIRIAEKDFENALWVENLPELLSLERADTTGSDGGKEAAEIVLGLRR